MPERSIRDDLLAVQRDIRKLRMAGFTNPLRAANQAVDALDRLVTLIDAFFTLTAAACQDNAARIQYLQEYNTLRWGAEWWEEAERQVAALAAGATSDNPAGG